MIRSEDRTTFGPCRHRRGAAAAIILATALMVPGVAHSQVSIRNISSGGVDLFFDGSIAIDVNQVLLFGLTEQVFLEAAVHRQDTPRFHETTISLAPVLIVPDYYYFILRYGFGIGTGTEEIVPSPEAEADPDDGRRFSHDLALDLNRETPRVYLNLGARGSYYPADRYWYVIPTIGARLPIGDSLSIYARYFFSYNSNNAMSNALLSEVSLSVAPRLSVKLGGTANAGASHSGTAWELSGITGLDFAIREGLALRYHFEYLGRTERADGIRNILVLDARF